MNLPIAVSVIVPVRNRAHILPATLESVRHQTFTDWECIVVDDHSTDESVEVAEGYARNDSRFRVVRLPDPKRYVNAARNYGLSLASGQFVNFLDSDDLIPKNKLAFQLAEFVRNPRLDVVTSRFAKFQDDPRVQITQVKSWPSERWLDMAVSAPSGLWQTGCALWRVDAIRSIGGWDESLMSWTDPELMIRAILSNMHIIRLEEVLLFLRRDKSPRLTSDTGVNRYDSISRGVLTSWRNMKQSGQATDFRRGQCALALYRLAWEYRRNGSLATAMKYWLRDSQAIDESWFRSLYGAVLLIVHHTPRLARFGPYLRRWYFYRQVAAVAPLPDLDHVPVDQLSFSQ